MLSSFVILPSYGILLFLLGFGNSWWGIFNTCPFYPVCVFGPNHILRTFFQGFALIRLKSTAVFLKILLFLFLHQYCSFRWFGKPPCVPQLESLIAACDEKGPHTWILWCFIPFHHLSTEAEIFFKPKTQKKLYKSFCKSEWWSNYRPVLKENVDKLFSYWQYLQPPFLPFYHSTFLHIPINILLHGRCWTITLNFSMPKTSCCFAVLLGKWAMILLFFTPNKLCIASLTEPAIGIMVNTSVMS